MIELIENKISQLKSDVEKTNSTIASLRETIRNARAQCKLHESNLAKISGAIEAFQGTASHLKMAQNKDEPKLEVVQAEASPVEAN